MKCVFFFLFCFLVSVSAQQQGVQAFYVLFSDQVRSSDFPEKVCQNAGKGPQGSECVDARKYTNGVFIASPQNMTKQDIQKVKANVPGSRVVAYWDFGDIPLLPQKNASECPFCKGHIMGDRPGRNCSTTYTCGPSPFLTALNEAFPSKLATHDITDGLPGVMIESYPGLAKYVWTNQSAELLADFLASWLQTNGFDGIYLDGYIEPDLQNFKNCTIEKEGCTSFIKAGHQYDIDGDGIPDSAAEIAGSYFAWAPAFVAMVRQKLGNHAVMLANSAGSLSDSSLSGVTIEMEACVGKRGGEFKCAAALDGQHSATASRGIQPVSVLWLTHAESMNATEQCKQVHQLQQKFPWVQAGTDFFDGSHIVC